MNEMLKVTKDLPGKDTLDLELSLYDASLVHLYTIVFWPSGKGAELRLVH